MENHVVMFFLFSFIACSPRRREIEKLKTQMQRLPPLFFNSKVNDHHEEKIPTHESEEEDHSMLAMLGIVGNFSSINHMMPLSHGEDNNTCPQGKMNSNPKEILPSLNRKTMSQTKSTKSFSPFLDRDAKGLVRSGSYVEEGLPEDVAQETPTQEETIRGR
uniref:Uncharacterized protein n=1 Tax=Rosa rugosa TaxID=74645 RepID=J7FWP9_ROSRU|nr:hypothetical protein [Rosa rugosa]